MSIINGCLIFVDDVRDKMVRMRACCFMEGGKSQR
jgi:hypothetical protein